MCPELDVCEGKRCHGARAGTQRLYRHYAERNRLLWVPAADYGRQDLVRKQAQHNITLFEQADVEVIVTDCATCGSTLKEYGQLLADDPAWIEQAVPFSKKVRDVSEFLASIPLEKPQGRIEARATYHDPCHLRRGQGVWKQPRALLKMIEVSNSSNCPKLIGAVARRAVNLSRITRRHSRCLSAR